MTTPIDRMIDGSGMRCAKCNAPRGGCECWESCSCGYSTERGYQCHNPHTSNCSTKVKNRGNLKRSTLTPSGGVLELTVKGGQFWLQEYGPRGGMIAAACFPVAQLVDFLAEAGIVSPKTSRDPARSRTATAPPRRVR